MPYRMNVMLCGGTGCSSNKSFKVKEALQRELQKNNLSDEIFVVMTGCNGFCARGPVMVVQPDGIFYQMLTENEVPHLVEEHFLKGRPIQKLMYTPPAEEVPIPKLSDIGFFKKQRLIVLRNRGLIDPTNIDEYIARDGYKSLAKSLFKMTPDEIIKEMKDSGLRGRGGAGFLTGLKWEFCKKSKDYVKYIICNADEGDPGAFMDRSVLESDPHSVIEGMIIGAYAISDGKKTDVIGYVYVRNEYPLAIENLTIAMEQAREYGLLGNDILGSGFNFDIKINRGAGAFVCGEETALISSVEGKLGEPRPRPPFPAQRGLFDCPTNINNVETWANIPVIIEKGAEWYANIGTEKSKGTKVFSVVGKINNTGLVEVPMGITLKEIIYDIGGGIPDNKKFKGVQTGGPSGGVIPEGLLDLRVDYERLTEAGAIMGSGGMIVMDENTCMVDIARYFLDFLKEESCGKCVACREGIDRMLEILNNICAGEGKEEDIELLEELALVVKDFALCALGGTAPNPVLSTLKYFKDEYIEHIKYKSCPAVVCKKIISSPCQYCCPLHQEVPTYLTLITQGKFKEALEIVRKDNPFPSICGRVCTTPCEKNCASGEGEGEPLAIKELKRFLADYELKEGIKQKIQSKKKYPEKVAIIGSGPSGLSCAYYLANYGYEVTIFETLPVIGGMMAVGIPEYRLPRKILNLEIEAIKNLGVNILTNKKIDNLDEIQKKYKAIFIATGAHKSIKLGVAGEEKEGALDAIEFLRDVNLGKKVKLGENLGVIGGGNAAIDAARVSKRLGCKNVTILYRRTKAEMPADYREVEAAIEEGINIQFLVAPTSVISTNGKLEGVRCIKMKLGDIDRSGRRRPIPIEGSEFDIKLDNLISAIGQEPDLSYLNGKIKTNGEKTISVDKETLQTNVPNVFAGGDVVSGPATVTQAIAHGKIAAESIHKYLRGISLERKYDVIKTSVSIEPIKLPEEEIEELKRPEMPSIEIEKRITGFDEVELGYSVDMAMNEAKRCLRCDWQKE